MKRFLLPLFIFFVFTELSAEISITKNIAVAGTLTSVLTSQEKTDVTNLTLTGYIDARDVKCMRDELQNLTVIDLSQAVINPFTGVGGTADPTVSVSYPANEMPQYSFYNYSGGPGKTKLVNFTLPNSITSIGLRAFSNCSGLTGISIPNSVTSISANAFYYCTSLASLTIGNSVSSIGNNSFSNCTNLLNVTIPNSVTSIGTSAFNNCSGITNIIFGILISSIGDYAFQNCSGILTITLPRSTPPTIYANTFTGVNKSTCWLYVPSGASLTYKATNIWNAFTQISESSAANLVGITVQIGANGSVQSNSTNILNGALIMLNIGDTKTFNFVPNTGYVVSTLTFNNQNVLSDLNNNTFVTPPVPGNVTLNVTFKKAIYKLTLLSAESGTVSEMCEYGSSPSFSFDPSVGWKINTVFFNGNDVTNSLVNGVYSVPAITENSNLTVSFVNFTTNVPSINKNIKVYSSNSEIIVEGTSYGESIEIFSANGSKLNALKSKGNSLSIPAESGKIYLIRIGFNTYKILL
jgi:hypothetical protein